MDWYVYVLVNGPGIAYTGIAKDVAARLALHNGGKGARFTRGRGPWRLLHMEGPFARGDALRREMAIKADPAFKARLKENAARVGEVSPIVAQPELRRIRTRTGKSDIDARNDEATS